MATINLGAIKFNWKGAYNSGTSYAVDDVVSSGGNSYVCIQAHSNQAVGDATAYWNIMSAKGTNGTNGTNGATGAEGGTTTLTTEGDMLYRDGSGVQRLAKGTANQELRMNSGATAPEWHTPTAVDLTNLSASNLTSGTIPNARYGTPTFNGSNITNLPGGDVVKVADGSISYANTLTISSLDTSTYKNFKLVMKNMQNKTAYASPLYLNLRAGSSTYSSNNHCFALQGRRVRGSVTDHSFDSGSSLVSEIQVNYNLGRDATSDQTQSLILNFTNLNTTNQKDVYIQSFGTSRQSNLNEDIFFVNGVGVVRTGQQFDGIVLFNNASTWSGDYQLYGYK